MESGMLWPRMSGMAGCKYLWRYAPRLRGITVFRWACSENQRLGLLDRPPEPVLGRRKAGRRQQDSTFARDARRRAHARLMQGLPPQTSGSIGCGQEESSCLTRGRENMACFQD